MKLYSENKYYKLYQGNMLDMLEVIEKESIDSIVCDPPYELNFMGKGWDNSGIAFNPDTWQKCYEVLKPGGYLLAFGGSRTYHRIACAIEDAGFEIRDTIMWLYGSGFPKSMSLGKVIEGKLTIGSANVRDIKKLDGIKENVTGGWNSNEVEQGKRTTEYEQVKTIVDYKTELGKKYDGWGTALKPSYEPIIVARKPFKGSCVDNVIKYGVGGINIDECRVEFKNGETNSSILRYNSKPQIGNNGWEHKNRGKFYNEDTRKSMEKGRFPANTILTYDETDFEEVCGGFPNTKNNTKTHSAKNSDNNVNFNASKSVNVIGYEDSGSAARYFMNCKYTEKDEDIRRYFYSPKASKKDRDEGLDEFEEVDTTILLNRKKNSAGINWEQGGTNAFSGAGGIKKNTHPTVKPTNLMQYLVRLVTPNGGTVLDPFNGSGSTGKAVMYENKERNKNYKYIGIELTEEYLPIAKARIEYVCSLEERQLNIFEIENGDNNE